MDKRTERFVLALTLEDRETLRRLSEKERLSQSAMVRRLIWKAAAARGIEGEKPCQN